MPRFFTQIHSSVANAAGLFARALSGAQLAVDGKLGKLPPGLRKPALVSAATVLVVLLAVLVGMARGADSKEAGEAVVESEGTPAVWDFRIPEGNPGEGRDLVPPEELFLPSEPDFLPGVLLGRERRAEWTQADALPWWRNPLADGEERWRARIERMIDEIMESVP